MPNSSGRTFLHYKLTAEMLCLGERIRGGLLRPCGRTFRYSSLVGALRSYFGASNTIHATARLVAGAADANCLERLSFAPRNRAGGLSVVPLEIEYLSNVYAEVFIIRTDETRLWPKVFDFSMGAMKSKGFGKCHLTWIGERTCQNPVVGELCARLPDQPGIRDAFGIRNVIEPVYGYLFSPRSPVSGVYVKSLFEGSRIAAYDILFSPEQVNT